MPAPPPTTRSVRHDGLRFAAREWAGPAGGPSLLLLHGLASSSRIWDLMAPLLARRFRVVAFDQRGHGLSSKPSSGYGFDQTSADAIAVARAMRLRRPILVGHSWGAMVALETAVRHPRSISASVQIDGGFGSMRGRTDWPTVKRELAPPKLAGMHVDAFRAGIPRWLPQGTPLTSEIEASFLSLMRIDRRGHIRPRLSRANHFRILHAIWEQDPVALLDRVRIPTLVIAAHTKDPSTDETEMMRAKRAAASRVREIAGSGRPVEFEWIDAVHDVPIQHPRALAGRIERFAARVLG